VLFRQLQALRGGGISLKARIENRVNLQFHYNQNHVPGTFQFLHEPGIVFVYVMFQPGGQIQKSKPQARALFRKKAGIRRHLSA